MYDDFIAKRLTQLRQAKGSSARDMSLLIGQNINYINLIENRKALPSMQVFFYICEYFKITPQEFFDTENIHPQQTKDLFEDLKRIDSRWLPYIVGLIKEIVRNQ